MSQENSTLRRLQLAELEIAKEIRRICQENGLRYFLVDGTLLGAVRHQGFIPWDDDMDVGMPRKDYERFLQCAASSLPDGYVLSQWNDATDYALPFAKVQLRDSFLEDPTTAGLRVSHGIWVDIFPYDPLPENVPAYGWYRLRLKLYFILNELKHGYRLEKSYQCPAWRAWAYRALRVVAKLTHGVDYSRRYEALMLRYKNETAQLCETSGLMGRRFIFPAAYFAEQTELLFEGELFAVPGAYHDCLRHAYGDYEQLPPEEQRVAWHNVKQICFAEKPGGTAGGRKSTMSTISLVMTTYNGQQRVVRQLESLRCQTRQPDEVLIFDDRSVDTTAQTVRTYLEQNRLDSWRFTVNESNLGWRANFAQAIGRAKGELLFLCDQDDVWHTEKIARMAAVMESHPEILLLCSNADVVYEGKRIQRSRQRFYTHKPLAKITFSAAHLNVGRPGCTYCIRTQPAQTCIREYWMPLLAHDALLWEYAVMRDGLYLLNESTIDFVRYGENASANGSRTKKFRIEAFERNTAYTQAALRMAQQPDTKQAEKKKKVLKTVREFHKRRVAFLRNPSVGGGAYLLRNIGCYEAYRNWLSDIYCALLT